MTQSKSLYACGGLSDGRITIGKGMFSSDKIFWTGKVECTTDHGCQIFLGPNIPKWVKIYQMTTNYTKLPYITPNGH
jgi:hypothetical protein